MTAGCSHNMSPGAIAVYICKRVCVPVHSLALATIDLIIHWEKKWVNCVRRQPTSNFTNDNDEHDDDADDDGQVCALVLSKLMSQVKRVETNNHR